MPTRWCFRPRIGPPSAPGGRGAVRELCDALLRARAGQALMIFRIFTVFAVMALAVSTWILSSPGRQPGPRPARRTAERPGYYLKNAL